MGPSLLLVRGVLLGQSLLAVHALAADRYHVRIATYACVDRRAALSSSPVTRANGRCFRVTPGQRLEPVSRAHHSLILMRIKPPIPGEPPLYFRTGSLSAGTPPAVGSLHQGRRQNDRRRTRNPTVETATQATAPLPPPAPILVAPLPATSVPVVQPAVVPASQSGSVAASQSGAAAASQSGPVAASQSGAVPADAGAPDPIRPAPAKVPAANPPASAASGAGPVSSRPLAATQAAPASEQRSSRSALFEPLLLWLVIIAAAMLLVRLVLVRASQRERQSERDKLEPQTPASQTPPWQPRRSQTLPRPPPGVMPLPRPPDPAIETAAILPVNHAVGVTGTPSGAPPGVEAIHMSDYKARCVARLRHAGWDARTRFSAGLPGPDVIARNNGLVLALQCHPWSEPVDVEAVEDACMIRERQHSDLAAIVASSSFTDAARQLAARTGIVLLHEDELASFAA